MRMSVPSQRLSSSTSLRSRPSIAEDGLFIANEDTVGTFAAASLATLSSTSFGRRPSIVSGGGLLIGQ